MTHIQASPVRCGRLTTTLSGWSSAYRLLSVSRMRACDHGMRRCRASWVCRQQKPNALRLQTHIHLYRGASSVHGAERPPGTCHVGACMACMYACTFPTLTSAVCCAGLGAARTLARTSSRCMASAVRSRILAIVSACIPAALAWLSSAAVHGGCRASARRMQAQRAHATEAGGWGPLNSTKHCSSSSSRAAHLASAGGPCSTALCRRSPC